MSIIPYKEYAPHIRRSVLEAIWEYKSRTGKEPTVIFAEFQAHAALACSPESIATPDGMKWMGIPLKMFAGGEYGIYLAGDPVKIRLTSLAEPQVFMNGGTT